MIKRLFVVDDEDVNILMARVLFQRDPFALEVEYFSNGLVAFQRYQQLVEGGLPPPELILLDLNMPLLDGWGLLDHLARYAQGGGGPPPPRVVIISSSIDRADKDRAFSYPNVVMYIDKPMEQSKMAQVKVLASH